MAKRSSQLATLRPSAVPSLLDATPPLPTLALNSPNVTTGALAVFAPQFNVGLIDQLRAFLGIKHVDSVPGLPTVQRFPVISRTNSEQDLELPFGVPRHVRAGLLKLLAGGRHRDNMLELKGDAWEFVNDKTWVDLTDRSRVFRVGRLQILS